MVREFLVSLFQWLKEALSQVLKELDRLLMITLIQLITIQPLIVQILRE